jgi:hypothetical protein
MEALSDTRSLTSASFSYVSFNWVGFQNLLEWLDDNKQLQSLRLTSDLLHDRNARDMQKLGWLVIALKKLRKVDLSLQSSLCTQMFCILGRARRQRNYNGARVAQQYDGCV